MIHSLINDYLIRLKNASHAEKKEVVAPFSKFIVSVSEILKKYGFVESYTVDKTKIITKINQIDDVKLFSTPGRKLYTKSTQIPWGNNPSSLIIISTSRGLMSQKEAVKAKLGGQLIAQIN